MLHPICPHVTFFLIKVCKPTILLLTYIKNAQEDAGFLDFFFLSADGNYKLVTGENGYLGLQEDIEEDIRQGNDVISNAAVPGKSQLLVFATPRAHGSYQGFEYDAIAIAYENSDIVDVLDIS